MSVLVKIGVARNFDLVFCNSSGNWCFGDAGERVSSRVVNCEKRKVGSRKEEIGVLELWS